MNRARNLILLFSVLMTLAISASCGGGTKEQTVSPETKIAFLSRPGVVLMVTQYEGYLLDSNGNSQVDLYYGNDYLGVVELPALSTGGMGSGFIISRDGYIVTNAHVVYMEEDQVKQSFAYQATMWAADNIPQYYEYYGYPPYPATQEDLVDIYNYFYTDYTLQANREVNAFMGKSITGFGTVVKGYPAEVRKISAQQLWYSSQGQVVRAGKDVAIIKIEADSLPTVRLGDSDAVQTGDRVIAVGYPGLVTDNPSLSPESIYEASVTSGLASAQRTMPDGAKVIQTDAAITHGNSGGPAFNSAGEVIGITTFGSGRTLSSGEWLDVEGFNFLVPVNIVKSFVNELNIDTSPSIVDEHYAAGMQYYWKGNYKKAIAEFEAILRLSPGDAYASEYVTMCEIAQEK